MHEGDGKWYLQVTRGGGWHHVQSSTPTPLMPCSPYAMATNLLNSFVSQKFNFVCMQQQKMQYLILSRQGCKGMLINKCYWEHIQSCWFILLARSRKINGRDYSFSCLGWTVLSEHLSKAEFYSACHLVMAFETNGTGGDWTNASYRLCIF